MTTSPSVSTEAETFDLSSLAVQLDRVKHTRRLFLLLPIGTIIFLFLLFVPETIARGFRGDASSLEIGVTLMVVLMGGGILGISISGIRKLGPTAVVIRLDGKGIEVEYPRGASRHHRWNDPNLSMKLFDFSDSAHLFPVETRYSVMIDQIESALTPEAFNRLYSHLDARSLIKRSERVRSLFYPVGVAPLVHIVSSRGN